jgi:hypothetical protein
VHASRLLILYDAASNAALRLYLQEDRIFPQTRRTGENTLAIMPRHAGDPETERDDDVLVTDREFAKAVAKGITLIASSGDDGGGYHQKHNKLITNYPPSSPFILAVGGK